MVIFHLYKMCVYKATRLKKIAMSKINLWKCQGKTAKYKKQIIE